MPTTDNGQRTTTFAYMGTAGFFWPLLMVLALVAAGLFMKRAADHRKRKKKGIKQHPKVP